MGRRWTIWRWGIFTFIFCKGLLIKWYPIRSHCKPMEYYIRSYLSDATSWWYKYVIAKKPLKTVKTAKTVKFSNDIQSEVTASQWSIAFAPICQMPPHDGTHASLPKKPLKTVKTAKTVKFSNGIQSDVTASQWSIAFAPICQMPPHDGISYYFILDSFETGPNLTTISRKK